jgi:GT2 family glycosyltransferase
MMNAFTRQLDPDASPAQMVQPAAHGSGRVPPRVSVVTCAYTGQRWDALVDAVASAQAQDPPPHEVVVVVDHNDDLLKRAIDEFPRARVFGNEESRGLSGARNTGVRRATGEIVAFLDDDARARPGWLSALARAFEDPTVIGAGGVAAPVWESPAPSWIPAEFLWVIGCSYRGLPSTAAEIRNPIGANMAFRRAVLERVGGFADGIGRVGRTPLGCEETELSIRARAATGGRIVQIPDAQVDHRVSPDRTRWRYFRRRCWAEGLSKAIVSRSVGSDAALESERSYVTRTLPTGVGRGLADALRGDRSGVARSLAIVIGLMITVAGYLVGLLAASLRGHR